MEHIVEGLISNYTIITLANVIVGYLITTTPYLERAKDYVPIIVTVIGVMLSVLMYGNTVENIVLGALSGILSTGLYELFGKGIKNLGEYLENKYKEGTGGG